MSPAGHRPQQVLYRLAINLQERDLHRHVALGVIAREIKDVTERARDNAGMLVRHGAELLACVDGIFAAADPAQAVRELNSMLSQT